MKTTRGIFAHKSTSYRLLLAFLGLNVPLILMILIRDAGGTSDLSWLTGLYISTLALGYYGSPLLIVATLIFLLLLPVRRIAFVCIGILVTFFIYFLFMDSTVFGIFKFHINLFWVEYALKDYDSLGVPRSTLAVILAILPGIAAVEAGIFLLATRLVTLKRLVWTVPPLVLSAFVVSQTVHALTYHRNNQQITSLTPYFPAYKPVTAYRSIRKYGDFLPLDYFGPQKDDAGYEATSILYPLSELRFDGVPGGRPLNIIVLLLESWRYDAFDEKTTPNLFAFGCNCSVFMNHLSSGNQTTCGLFGLFYGLHPTYWSAVKANSVSIDNPILIDVMKEHGYAFGIFAKSNFERHKIKETMFNGIEIHETFSGLTIPEKDRDLTNQVLKFMEENARDRTAFLALAFFKSSHAPFHYPREHAIFGDTRNLGLAQTKNTDPEPFLNDYRNSVHYVDALVGEILDKLKTLGVLDQTVVVITTDHGESFNEQGSNYWGHGSNYTQHQLRVPFILHAPGRPPLRVERRTCHIDLPPTLLHDYFGCTSDISAYSSGRNLFDESQAPRPLVMGSYVSHAFVFGDDVFEIMLGYTKKYKLDDLYAVPSLPSPDLLKTAIYETSRFFKPLESLGQTSSVARRVDSKHPPRQDEN